MGRHYEDFEIESLIDLAFKDGYKKGKTDAVETCTDKFAKILSNINQICGRGCPVDCNWGTTTNCKEMCRKWLIEQLKES